MSAFTYSTAAVVALSFLGLALGWSRPKFATFPWRRLPSLVSRVGLSAATLWLGRCAVLAATVFVAAAAAFGSTRLNANVAPVSVFVVWWVGLVPLSVLFGDVWRALNPWATVARLLRVPARSARQVPSWLGVWPAVGLLVAFAFFQLVYPTAASPRLIAGLVAGYSVTTLGAMWWFGVEEWLDRGEVFSVYSGMLARVSVFEVRRVDGERRLGLRPPLVAVTQTPREDSYAAFVLAAVGTAIFDGLLASDLWAARDAAATQRLTDLGVDPFAAGLLAATLGLAVTVVAVTAAYRFACRVSELAGGWGDLCHRRGTAVAFVHALVPIALAYAVAHYSRFSSSNLRT